MTEHEPGLRRGALSTGELVAVGLANIAPAIASFFVLGAVTAAAGVGTPLVVLIAGIGFALHVNSTAEFSRVTPSAGFYVTYLGRAFGAWAGAMGAAVYTLGQFIIGLALFFQIGVWTSTSVQAVSGYPLPWWIPTLVVEALVALAIVRGVRLSVRAAITMFGFELAVLAAGAAAMLARSHAAITGAGFLPASISGGLSGLGLGFPLAIFLFLGSSTPAPFAEETSRPRATLPRAVFATVALAIVIYTGIAWAEGIGFGNNVRQLASATFPFITGSARALPALTDFMYAAGFTSATAVLLAAGNAVNRVWFAMAREGMLPRWLGVTHPRYHTPARVVAVSLTLMMIATLALGATAGAGNGFGWTAALGTIGIVVLFIAVNVALTVYFYRRERARFRIGRHLIVPVLGTLAFAWPLWQTVKPGQEWPYDWFGAIWLAFLALAAVYATAAVRRGATAGEALAAEAGAGAAAPAPAENP
jgi:amino acid transporter